MIINIHKTGGIAGIAEELGPLDTSDLDHDARKIRHAVHHANFFRLPTDIGGGAVSDDFVFTAHITDGTRFHTVSWDSSTAESHRSALAAIVGACEAAGGRFINWRREGTPLDWTRTHVAIKFAGGFHLTVEGTSPVPMTVRFSPHPDIGADGYREVDVLGVTPGHFSPQVVSAWTIAADLDELTGGGRGIVLVGKTLREHIPPFDNGS
ncbi:protealysin inhibitor emfourin [Gordonia sp. CPCC 205515]|uniref:protealysin inhibitor emfourin n=1 Tax=Gordonia sp. CPCC 205515 TaxID=3140791 RepID=UPI003AF3928A